MMRSPVFWTLDWSQLLLGYYSYEEIDMTIYGQKISYDRTTDEYVVASATPSYLSNVNFFSNQINSSKIQNMSKKLNTLEEKINAE